MTSDRIAYVDESIRSESGLLYVVGAVVVDPVEGAGLKEGLRVSIGSNRPPFHWRNESATVRQKAVGVLLEHGPDLIVVFHRGPPRANQERIRRKCVERLLWEGRDLLAGLVIESRGSHGDARDRRTIRQAQDRRLVSRALGYDFLRAAVEPLLWAADAIAGAVGSALENQDQTYAELVSQVTLHEVP